MKANLLTTIALLTVFAVPALADTQVINGCQVIQAENGNYWFKTDNACQFDRTGLGNRGDGKPLPVVEEIEEPEEPEVDTKV